MDSGNAMIGSHVRWQATSSQLCPTNSLPRVAHAQAATSLVDAFLIQLPGELQQWYPHLRVAVKKRRDALVRATRPHIQTMVTVCP
jgi:hypothetical protein